MDVDLKLLTVFEEVYKTGSVSQAAANIGATQPAISIGLGKLRRLFNDPLFVLIVHGSLVPQEFIHDKRKEYFQITKPALDGDTQNGRQRDFAQGRVHIMLAW